MDLNKGHGASAAVGSPFVPFTSLLTPRPSGHHDKQALAALGNAMAMNPDSLSDGPDPEENLYMPAGYTYFGQFVDHDLTLDTTSTLNPRDIKDPDKALDDPTNLRSPSFDLDCVYGTGPGDRPFMYVDSFDDNESLGLYKGATLLIDEADLRRASNHRAIIGDKRNDENSIVNQIQQLFIRFHNKVVAELAAADPKLRGSALFDAARQQVTWAYQQILMDDYLPRIVDAAVLDNFLQGRKADGSFTYQLYKDAPKFRRNLPREFVAAAYRFGHSAVRTGYRLNGQEGPNNGLILPIFTNPAGPGDLSLVGFDPLPRAHIIDNWGRFFPAATPKAGERLMANVGDTADIGADGKGGNGKLRLQYAYKIDPSISDPLANLPPAISAPSDLPQGVKPVKAGPSLAVLNLERGNIYGLPSGQALAQALNVPKLDRKYLVIRQSETLASGDKVFFFTPLSDLPMPDGSGKVGHRFDDDTPLWFYVLAEAQQPVVDFWIDNGRRNLTEDDLKGVDANGKAIDAGSPAATLKATRCTGTRLGPVGGRIVTEVFYGLLESDRESVLCKAPKNWKPIWGGAATMTELIRYADPLRAPI